MYVKNISTKAKYKIYSTLGRLISTGIILNNTIDLSNLINGIYMIEIEDGNTTVHKKLIKES
ncbi:T9SS type A sorting domain-containing protein [Chryseobacterium sp. R2ACT005]|uniref:T9SS type A sorting domain-containing protein n=1 Tax=Chryseobacterium sp. R2ACT005 TaxID=3416668 RepID=UPI003CEF47B1